MRHKKCNNKKRRSKNYSWNFFKMKLFYRLFSIIRLQIKNKRLNR